MYYLNQFPGLCTQNKTHSSPQTTPVFAKNTFQPLHVLGGCGQTVGEVAGAGGAVVGVAALEGTYSKGHIMWV